MSARVSTHRPYIELALVLLLVCIATGAHLLPGKRTVDDAYITFRYARNLVDGAGLVYNPGERVLGTTTPLYTLVMAVLAALTGVRDFPTLALVFNALAGGLSVALLYLLGKHISGQWAPAAAAALLWALAPYSVSFAVGGMETNLTIVLLLATSYAHITGRPRVMAALSGLAFLARPDTVLLTGPLWLDQLIARRRIPWREGLVCLAVVAPWLIFATLYFGSPLTHSIAAKSAAYRLPAGASFVRLLQHYATPFFEHMVLPPTGVVISLAIYCGLSALGGLNIIHCEHRSWPLIAYPFAYFAVFAVANPLLFRWYLSPPLPFYFLLILTGLWTLARDLGRLLTTGRPQAISLGILSLYTLAALGMTLNAWDLHPDHGPDRPAPAMAWFKLELLYDQAANIVLDYAAPDDTLCAGDIGTLGYETSLQIRDTVGLVSLEAASHYPADPSIYVINYAIPADLVFEFDPDYIVILEVYGRQGLLQDPSFPARYRLIQKLETDIYGSDGMLIFGRRP